MIKQNFIKIICIIILTIVILKLIKNSLYDTIIDRFATCTKYVNNKFGNIGLIPKVRQPIYPVSVTRDGSIEQTSKECYPTLNSNILNNLRERIKNLIQSIPINLDKYISTKKQIFNVNDNEVKQILTYILSSIKGDSNEHRLDITKRGDKIEKMLYGKQFYTYEFKFNANYYTNKVGKQKRDMKFIGELQFSVMLLAKPRIGKTVFEAPLTISSTPYNLIITRLSIIKISPQNQYLSGLDKNNDKYKLIGETTYHPTGHIVTTDSNVEYDGISSILPDTLRNQSNEQSDYVSETNKQYSEIDY
jgi:hypothetical protein